MEIVGHTAGEAGNHMVHLQLHALLTETLKHLVGHHAQHGGDGNIHLDIDRILHRCAMLIGVEDRFSGEEATKDQPRHIDRWAMLIGNHADRLTRLVDGDQIEDPRHGVAMPIGGTHHQPVAVGRIGVDLKRIGEEREDGGDIAEIFVG